MNSVDPKGVFTPLPVEVEPGTTTVEFTWIKDGLQVRVGEATTVIGDDAFLNRSAIEPMPVTPAQLNAVPEHRIKTTALH